jgi:ABC-2 type transport system permease protein
MKRVLHLMRKEFLELRQEPRLFGIVIIAPLIQLTMLGYAATTDVRNVPVVVVDQDRSAASRDLVARFEVSDNFTIVDTVSASGDIDEYLDGGRAWMALVIPSDYGERVRTGRSVVVQVVADGTDANSTNVAVGYAGALVARYARELAAETGRHSAAPLVDADIRVWFNPGLESRDFMIPGILALVLLVVSTTLSSMAIVREKELGTLEQLNVTPLARWELIVGKLVPYAVLGMIDVLLCHEDRIEIVDYKTDQVSAEACDARAEEYRTQIDNYAAAIEGIYRRPVSHRPTTTTTPDRPCS